jgi:hypothetical protein
MENDGTRGGRPQERTLHRPLGSWRHEVKVDRAFYAAVDAFIKAADTLGAEWMFIGAVPLAAWGQARASTDADFVISLDLLGAWDLDVRMAKRGFSKISGPVQIPQSSLIVSNYVFERPQIPFKVDVFFSTTEWDKTALARRVKAHFGKRDYWIATAEDLLLYKLMAWRKRDVEDAASIVERSSESMDWDYIREWSGRMHVDVVLAQLLKDMKREP